MAVCYGVSEGTIGSLRNLRRVLGNRILGYRVIDILTSHLLVKFGPGIAPVVLLAQRNGINNFTVCKKVYRHIRSTITVLIVSIVPNLGNLNFGLLSLVTVGYGESPLGCRNLANNRRLVLLNLSLFYRVLNFFAVCELVQIKPGVLPLIISIQCYFSGFLTVCKQFDCNIAGTIAILIISIIPNLFNTYLRLFNRTAVLNSVGEGAVGSLGNLRAVISNRILGHCVVDGLTVLVLLKFCPRVRPVVVSVQFNRVKHRSALLQVDCDTVRTEALFVIRVIPNLGNLNLGLFKFTAVCYGVNPFVLGNLDDNRHLVIRKLSLFERILDFLAVSKLVQSGPGILPLVVLAKRCCSGFLAVCKQFHDYIIRTEPFLIVGVLPNQFNANLRLLNISMVRYQIVKCTIPCLCNRSLIVLYSFFGHSVANGLTVLVLLELLPGVSPFVTGVQFNGFKDLAILHQIDRDAVRTEALFIVRVVPNLGNLNLGLFVITTVRYCEYPPGLGNLFNNRNLVICNLSLFNSKFDFLAVFVLIISPGVLPLVSLTKLCCCNLFTVRQQTYDYNIRAEAFLIVGVIPNHLDTDIGHFPLMSVRYHEGKGIILLLSVFDRVLLYVFFSNFITNLFSTDLLRKIRPTIAPIRRLAHRYSIDHLTVCQQLNLHCGRAETIIVPVIFPNNFSGHVNSFQCVCNLGATDCFGKTVYRLGFNSIRYRRNSVETIHRKFGSIVVPAIFPGNFNRFYYNFVVFDEHCNTLGHQFFHVALKLPNYVTTDSSKFRNKRIGNRRAVNVHVETVKFYLFDCISYNGCTVFLKHRKITGLKCPVRPGNFNLINTLVALLNKNDNALRNQRLIVALHFPHHIAGDLNCLQRIFDCGAFNRRLKSDNGRLKPVCNLRLAVFPEFRQLD